MDDNFEDVVANIKACLNSSKDQTSIATLNRDYRDIIGSSIPYRKLGFNTLEDLIRAVPNLKINRRGNEFFIDLEADAKTAHIAKLVREQNATKKKKRFSRHVLPPRRNFGVTRNNYNSKPFSKKPQSNYKDYVEKDQPFHEKYKISRPSQYDFTEEDLGEEDFGDFNDYDSHSSDEIQIVESHKSNIVQDKAVTDNFKNLHITVENRHFGTGRSNVSLRGGFKMSRSYPHQSSSTEDVGYMDGGSEKVDKKDDKQIPNRNKTLPKTSPARLLAAGRAAQQELPKPLDIQFLEAPSAVTKTDKMRTKISPSPLFASAMKAVYGEDVPFKPMNNNNNMYARSHGIVSPILPVSPASPVSSKSPKSENSFASKPSKMNEDKMFKPGPDYTPPYAENTKCQKLFALAMKYRLGTPVFSNFHKTDPRKKQTLFMCKLKINGMTFPKVIFEDTDLNRVHEFAAEEALQEFSERFEKMESAKFDTVTEKQQIISRITDIVSPHPSGLKTDFIEKEFKERYKEKLPADWLNIVKSFSLLSVDAVVGGTCVYPPQDTRGDTQSVNKLPPLILPESDHWYIFVTTCQSTKCVYFRIVGEEYDAKYDLMAQAMENTYKEKEDLRPVDVIKEGRYYASCLQGEWYRVKVLSADPSDNSLPRVSLVDHGDTDYVLPECIFPLAENLTDLPAQAVKCGLTGLEEFHDNDYVTQTVCAMTGFRSRDALVARVDSRNPHLMLTLFDTTTDDDIDVNALIRDKIEKELSAPKLPSKSNLGDVYLTKVEENGRAFVQIISEGLKLLMSLMAEVNQQILKYEHRYRLKSITNLVGVKMVLAKYEGDQKWHRAEIISLLNGDKAVEVRFIDYGNTEIVPIDHIAELKDFSNVLFAIPPQAVEVDLMRPNRELFTQSVIDFLMSLAQPRNSEQTVPRLFLMKVLQNVAPADVELFLRDDDNLVLRLNDIIGAYYPEYRGPNYKDVRPNLAGRPSPSEKPKSSRRNDLNKILPELQPFPVPPSGSQLRVYVSMIANPGHFVVQPLEFKKDLDKMCEEMKEYYTKEKPAVEVNTIVVGNLFAIENEEKKWCRGSVILVLKDLGEVSLKCIDYGNIVTVNFQNVYTLIPRFRKLPALAIKAELAGIAPIHKDWNMHDCLRFHELLNKKQFVSVIVEESDDIVSLMLYDTSAQADVNIGAILVEEGRANDLTLE